MGTGRRRGVAAGERLRAGSGRRAARRRVVAARCPRPAAPRRLRELPARRLRRGRRALTSSATPPTWSCSVRRSSPAWCSTCGTARWCSIAAPRCGTAPGSTARRTSGPGTRVLGGEIRGSVIGPVCRVRGEISESVFLGYANKAHDGFVGHSVVGRWVNLGAGTITSNLKNTYGTVRLEVGGRADRDRPNERRARCSATMPRPRSARCSPPEPSWARERASMDRVRRRGGSPRSRGGSPARG